MTLRRSNVAATIAAAHAIVVAVVAGACGPQFATVTLLAREPEGKDRFHTEDQVNVFFGLDSPNALVSDSFKKGTPPVTPAFDLEHRERKLFTAMSTNRGDDVLHPTAFGRANFVPIPSSDSEGFGARIERDAPLLLAKPNFAEPIVSTIPTARTGSAACSDADGRAWVVGGKDGSGNVQKGYSFLLDTLKANIAFDADVTGDIACDGDGTGGVIVAGTVNGKTQVIFDASSVNGAPDVESLDPDDDAAMAVQVVGNVAWVFDSINVTLFHRTGGAPIARAGNNPADPNAHLLALDENDAIVFHGDGTAQLIQLAAGTTLVSSAIANVPSGYQATDARAHLVLHNTGGGFELVEPVLAFDTVTFKTKRSIAFDGIEPDEIIELSDGRIAGFQRKNGTAFVDVEKSPQAVVGDREHMTRTIGDALILFGGGDGHDVVTTP